MKKIFTLALAIALLSLINPQKAAANTNQIDVWWPTQDAHIQGTTPFKTLLQNTDIKTYKMYWQVDNGQLNEMPDNYTDFQHKEVIVDLSGWHWHDNGVYVLTFSAKDASGNVLASKSVTIHTDTNAVVSVPLAAAQVTISNSPINASAFPTTSPTTITTAVPIASVQATVPVVLTPVVVAAPAQPSTPIVVVTQPTQPISKATQVWWPANGATLTSNQPFKAMLENTDVNQYKMYWQVDGGQLNEMQTNYTDAPHKEVTVDLSGWNWKGSGPYTIHFVAKDLQGTQISSKSIVIYVPQSTNSAAGQAPQVITPTVVTAPVVSQPQVPLPSITAPVTVNPLSGMTFYVNPTSNAKAQADIWKTSRPADATTMIKLSQQPDSKWIGNWNSDVQSDVNNYVSAATTRGQTPVLIAYDIPGRDCGSYSAGGANSPAGYRTWIANVASGIAHRKTIVVLEPDALAGITCLSQNDQTIRSSLLKEAVVSLKAAGAIVYLDAGNSNWVGAQDMSVRLKNAGIDQADGFSLNVSNFYTTNDNINFGTNLSKLVGDKHFVIDTSRNGNGSNGSEWCNPSGRAVGKTATTNTGNLLVDAFLWLKVPGESDGTCNGGPSAGVWWPDYALSLAKAGGY